jgi:anti-sigma factor (TIGR02949 family)
MADPGPESSPADLSCRECIDLLVDYVDGALPAREARDLEEHLAGCPPCVAFLNTYRGTVDAARRLRAATLPPELRARLVDFLKRPRPALD